MTNHALIATGLTKRFGGVTAVNDVSISLPRGQVTALLGPNGAGKTTVFNLMTGRIKPDAGGVEYLGEDISHTSVARRARLGIGRTFQDVRLFPELTVLENAAVYAQEPVAQSLLRTILTPSTLWRENHRASTHAMQALEYVGMDAAKNRLARDLSYAEQKLVSIARLLAMSSDVLLLDEPASGVDDTGRATLTALLRRIADSGRAVCLVEHNLDVVRAVGDSVVFIAEGRVVAEGAPSEIFASRALAEIYFGTLK